MYACKRKPLVSPQRREVHSRGTTLLPAYAGTLSKTGIFAALITEAESVSLTLRDQNSWRQISVQGSGMIFNPFSRLAHTRPKLAACRRDLLVPIKAGEFCEIIPLIEPPVNNGRHLDADHAPVAAGSPAPTHEGSTNLRGRSNHLSHSEVATRKVGTCPGLCLGSQQLVGLGCHDEIVPMKAVDLMCPPLHGDLPPLGDYERMMVLRFGNLGDPVRKLNSPGKIGEFEDALEALLAAQFHNVPLGNLGRQFGDFDLSEGRIAATAGDASELG